MNGPQARLLSDGRRLHLNHGPIDLIVEAFGEAGEVQLAYRQAVERFQTILGELVDELTELRKPASVKGERALAGSTAQRMEAAVVTLAQDFITPMAAVAGAVADEIMTAMKVGRGLDKAYVNNGGDIALHIAPGHSLTVAIGGTGHGLRDRITVQSPRVADLTNRHTPTPNPSPQGGGGHGGAYARSPSPLWGGVRGGGGDNHLVIRGIATSGWRGRSFSLGIADAVTVLARTAAEADAAATIIANAVNLPGHPAITRQAARDLAPDSDLGDRLVTTGVGYLSASEIGVALASGCRTGEELAARGLIVGAALFLAGESRVVGDGMPAPSVGHPNHSANQRPSATIGSMHA